MKTILISDDPDLLSRMKKSGIQLNENVVVFNESKDPLDVMSTVCKLNPFLLIIDDDFLSPETVHILESIRKVNQRIEVIFCTSDSSIDLGKKISQIGIHYYAIKPLTDGELQDSFEGLLKLYKKKTIHL
jgi:response regulator of citrate/malate metabolism